MSQLLTPCPRCHEAGGNPYCICAASMRRTKVATSHNGKWSYWRDPDGYIYQRNEVSNCWCGWFCAAASWDKGMKKAEWITLIPSRAACCGENYTCSLEDFYATHTCPNAPTGSFSRQYEEEGETGAPCRDADPQGWS